MGAKHYAHSGKRSAAPKQHVNKPNKLALLQPFRGLTHTHVRRVLYPWRQVNSLIPGHGLGFVRCKPFYNRSAPIIIEFLSLARAINRNPSVTISGVGVRLNTVQFTPINTYSSRGFLTLSFFLQLYHTNRVLFSDSTRAHKNIYDRSRYRARLFLWCFWLCSMDFVCLLGVYKNAAQEKAAAAKGLKGG